MRFSRLRSLLLASPLALPAAAYAQGDRASPIVLSTSGGTRGAAMADAMLGARDDEALFYSPAQLVIARGTSASWTGADDVRLRTVAAAFQVGTLGVAAGARVLDFHAFALPFTASDFAGDLGAPATSLALTAGAARTVKGFRLGATVSYGQDQLRDTRVARTTADVGIARPVGPVTVALAAQNLGTSSDDEGVSTSPPTRVSLGFNGDGLSLGSSFDLAGGAAFGVNRDGRVLARTGWELSWVWIEGYALATRVGVRRPEWHDQSPVTLGAGLRLHDNYFLDWAFEPTSGDLPASNRIGLRIR